jgi:hypothetical protein
VFTYAVFPCMANARGQTRHQRGGSGSKADCLFLVPGVRIGTVETSTASCVDAHRVGAQALTLYRGAQG